MNKTDRIILIVLKSLRRGKAGSWIGYIADPVDLDKDLERYEKIAKRRGLIA